jgi:hypothetical protein
MVSMFEMNMRPGPSVWPPGTSPGRTYRFYTGETVLPFGFGEFALHLPRRVCWRLCCVCVSVSVSGRIDCC